jgi:pimeloyl-ACP methyl ester carboxylesterase
MDVERVLDRRDRNEAPLQPGCESSIRWVADQGRQSDVAVVFLHGWSASPTELDPVDVDIAARLGANLIRFRLTAHGLSPNSRGGLAMRDSATRDALLRDVSLAFELGKAAGRRVVVVGVSTGASLAAWLSVQPGVASELVAVVLFSPAFALTRIGWRLYSIFKWLILLVPQPLAIAAIHIATGKVSGQAQAAELAVSCATEYTDRTTHWPMAALLNCVEVYLSAELALRAACASSSKVRTLIFANPKDDTVDYEATRRVVATIPAAELALITTSEHPHVISGNRSPSTSSACTERAVRFVRDALVSTCA